jgi:GcrA cell cycle regulator
MIWTAATINEMYALLDEGLSQSAIGERMGCTKNVIAGKLRRLHDRPRPIPQPKPEAAPRPGRSPRTVVMALPPPPPEPVRACQYPHGNPRERGFGYCGAAVTQPGGVYCDACRSIAYQRRAA